MATKKRAKKSQDSVAESILAAGQRVPPSEWTVPGEERTKWGFAELEVDGEMALNPDVFGIGKDTYRKAHQAARAHNARTGMRIAVKMNPDTGKVSVKRLS